jgi:bacterioferritin
MRIGQTVIEMFESDRGIEVEAVALLRNGIEHMRTVGDVTSARLFESILQDEENHVDYIETQLALIAQLGEAIYLAKHLDPTTG